MRGDRRTQSKKSVYSTLIALACLTVSFTLGAIMEERTSIQPYRENPWYWKIPRLGRWFYGQK